MKICVVQTNPVKGDISRNIEKHKTLIALALTCKADTIIFSELSITGYEPELAEELATTPNDSRFDDFQAISDAHQVTIGIGVPTKDKAGICISMILFHPYAERQVYSKKYLHSDEEPCFSSGRNFMDVIHTKTNIALAICYELSVPEHAEKAFKLGANIYVASVAKSINGVVTAVQRLSEIAQTYSMTVLMSNSIGLSDGMECGGKTSIWNSQGTLLGQLDDTHEGILLIDTDTQEIIAKTL